MTFLENKSMAVSDVSLSGNLKIYSLPLEIITNLFAHLPRTQWSNLSRVCRHFYAAHHAVPRLSSTNILNILYDGKSHVLSEPYITNSSSLPLKIDELFSSSLLQKQNPIDRSRFVLLAILYLDITNRRLENILELSFSQLQEKVRTILSTNRPSRVQQRRFEELVNAVPDTEKPALWESASPKVLRFITSTMNSFDVLELALRGENLETIAYALQHAFDTARDMNPERYSCVQSLLNDQSIKTWSLILLASSHSREALCRLHKYDQKFKKTKNVSLVLHEAIVQGDITLESPLLQILCWIFVGGSALAVKALLADKHVDPSRWESIALHYCIKQGDTGTIMTLLEDGRVDPTARDNDALVQAAAVGDNLVVQYLLKNCPVDPSAQDNAALKSAAHHGHLATFKLLLQDGRVHAGFDLIPFGVKSNSPEIVQVLLANPRANPNIRNCEALKTALKNRYTRSASLLINDHRFDPGDAQNRRNIIRLAVQIGDSAVVSHLLDHPKFQLHVYGVDFLCYAIQFKQLKIFKMTLNHPKLDFTTCFVEVANDIFDPLNHTCYETDYLLYEEMLKYLIYHEKADMKKFGAQLFQQTARFSSTAAMTLLRKHPKVDMASVIVPALYTAVSTGNYDTAQWLLSCPTQPDESLDHVFLEVAMAHKPDTELMEQLMDDPRVDPSCDNNSALSHILKTIYYTDNVPKIDFNLDYDAEGLRRLSTKDSNLYLKARDLLLGDSRVRDKIQEKYPDYDLKMLCPS